LLVEPSPDSADFSAEKNGDYTGGESILKTRVLANESQAAISKQITEPSFLLKSDQSILIELTNDSGGSAKMSVEMLVIENPS